MNFQMNPDVNFIFVPVIFSMIFASLIIHCFLSVYEMTVDTIFLCYCEDSDQNDGCLKPFFMSDDLKRVMKRLEIAGERSDDRENVQL